MVTPPTLNAAVVIYRGVHSSEDCPKHDEHRIVLGFLLPRLALLPYEMGQTITVTNNNSYRSVPPCLDRKQHG